MIISRIACERMALSTIREIHFDIIQAWIKDDRIMAAHLLKMAMENEKMLLTWWERDEENS